MSKGPIFTKSRSVLLCFIVSSDKKMIAFSVEQKVDFIGISFVESAKHLNLIRKLIKKDSPKIVAKIENKKGVESLEEIIHEADVIMIDRGDLATETNIETLGINQKKIIKKAIDFSKPVIVATEMLDNMIKHPYPTKNVLFLCLELFVVIN